MSHSNAIHFSTHSQTFLELKSKTALAYAPLRDPPPNFIPSDLHHPRDKLRRGHRIKAIAKMRRQYNRQPITDQISAETVRVIFIRRDVLQCLPFIRVAEEDHGRDVQRGGSGELLDA